MKVRLHNKNCRGYDCVEFTNGTIQLMIPKGFGPRIISAGFKNETNLFGSAGVSAKTRKGTWKIYGGHRLWTSPEIGPVTYFPDNDAIGIKYSGGTLKLTQDIPKLGINKQLELKFIDRNKVRVVHSIRNTGRKELNIAVWAISVMGRGGFAIIPQNVIKQDAHGYLPTRNIVAWRYTDLKDKRFKLTDRYCYVKQGGEKAFKIGQLINSGWTAYFNKGYLFVKKIKCEQGKLYADFYSNVEIYSCGEFLELETLGPMVALKKGATACHTEVWEFYKNRKMKFGE
jgi:hypothetical protein